MDEKLTPATPSTPPVDSPRFNLWNEARFFLHVVRPRSVTWERTGTSKSKHTILLHGWHSTESQMRRWHRELEVACPDRSVWRLTYDTHWKSFARSARQVLVELNRQHVDWDDVVVIGFSMGGIVARQMVAYGFPARAVIALCSPHHGALGWSNLRYPLISDPGASTLTHWSRHLQRLNSHPRDIAARKSLHLLSITFEDGRGRHDHDGIVGRASAAGEELGAVASRSHAHFDYGKRAFFTDPHMQGMNPSALPAMREHIQAVLDGN
jgi:pimeloyl-ACP methyl ester carboxylesterase